MTYILIILAFLALILLAFYYAGYLIIALYLAYLVMIFCTFTLVILVIHFYRVTILGNAPYIRSGKKLIDKVIAQIPFENGAIVYELGSGDCRFLRNLARQKKVQATGFESFFLPYAIAKAFNYFTHSSVKCYHQNFFTADLSKPDYIFCYLVPNQMDKLEAKLQKELKPGALVISNTFKFKNWHLEKEIIINEKNKFGLSNKIYLYRKV